MSAADVDIVRDLQPEGDLVAFFDEPGIRRDLFLPNFESVFVVESATPTVRNHGIDGLVAVWRDWLAAYAEYHLEVEEVLDAGEHVVVLARIRARTRRDGVEVEHSPGALWTLTGGKVARIAFYLNRAEALAVAGLAS